MSILSMADRIEIMCSEIYDEFSWDADNIRANRVIEIVTPLLPKLREWIPYNTDDGCYQMGWECSECHNSTTSWVTQYCPHCGAYMENYGKIMRHHTTLDRETFYGKNT